MLFKTVLENLANVNPKLALTGDCIMALIIMNTADIKLILFYFTIVIINLIMELFFRQMKVLSEQTLTAQNIERMAEQKFELHSNVKLMI